MTTRIAKPTRFSLVIFLANHPEEIDVEYSSAVMMRPPIKCCQGW